MVLNFEPAVYWTDFEFNKNIKFVKKLGKEKISYLNIPVSLDIETSSFYNNKQKVGLPYIWQICIEESTVYGRTFEELLKFLDRLKAYFNININNRIIIYIHNLSYEFQFINPYFKWNKVFSIDERKPLFGITEDGIEYRCSYLLSGYSLEKLADQLHEHEIKKLVGNLDYNIIRTPLTKLTDEELEYCFNDVRIVCAYIQECINTEGNIAKIPLTKTGYVRRYCRNACFYVDNSHRGKENNIKIKKYQKLINRLWLEPVEYALLKQAFMGGFTHASNTKANKIIKNVKSYDFASSYPAVMVMEKFPMGKGREIEVENFSESDLYWYMARYCCLITLKLYDLEEAIYYEHPLSSSKCHDLKDCLEDNGRVISLKEATITITEQDFYILKKFYNFDYELINLVIYQKDYLPKDLVLAILKLYSDKTSLKGIQEKIVEYLVSKGMLNATYGMAVTDIVRDEINFITDWTVDPPDLEEQIKKYNHDKKRFLSYPWGVWVTAYARKNLFNGIVECGEDYIYADTDSIKLINYIKHDAWFQKYNEKLRERLQQIATEREIDFELFEPKTIKGIKKLIGVWEDEGVYDRFKTLGAKRYLTQAGDKYKLTVAGVNSEKALEYLLTLGDPFDYFCNEMLIPAEYTGKLTHTYIDEPRIGTIYDYKGVRYDYNVPRCIHLEPATFELSMTQTYLDYILYGKVTKTK